MSRKTKLKHKHKRQVPVIEALEPRILLSADLPGLDLPDTDLDDPQDADVESVLAQAVDDLQAAAREAKAALNEAVQDNASV